MKIAIIGLGLIGGSMAKALMRSGSHEIFGFDRADVVLQDALQDGAIHAVLQEKDLAHIEIVLLALYPKDAIAFVRAHAEQLPRGCIVCDCGGVKRVVCDALSPIAKKSGFSFVGGHPMAGREFSGFLASRAELFDGASMILTPQAGDEHAAETLKTLFSSLGFRHVVYTTPEHHDRMIAFTSQLAHVVSSAYIKSPEATQHDGYSAGSYRDMTRVARLNEDMWTELFLENREPLVAELDQILTHLTQYREAIATGDEKRLHDLLRDGRIRKEQIDRATED